METLPIETDKQPGDRVIVRTGGQEFYGRIVSTRKDRVTVRTSSGLYNVHVHAIAYEPSRRELYERAACMRERANAIKRDEGDNHPYTAHTFSPAIREYSASTFDF
jgi:RNase P/RNase MRP subunit p30